jgi:hypothetical protein
MGADVFGEGPYYKVRSIEHGQQVVNDLFREVLEMATRHGNEVRSLRDQIRLLQDSAKPMESSAGQIGN